MKRMTIFRIVLVALSAVGFYAYFNLCPSAAKTKTEVYGKLDELDTQDILNILNVNAAKYRVKYPDSPYYSIRIYVEEWSNRFDSPINRGGGLTSGSTKNTVLDHGDWVVKLPSPDDKKLMMQLFGVRWQADYEMPEISGHECSRMIRFADEIVLDREKEIILAMVEDIPEHSDGFVNTAPENDYMAHKFNYELAECKERGDDYYFFLVKARIHLSDTEEEKRAVVKSYSKKSAKNNREEEKNEE